MISTYKDAHAYYCTANTRFLGAQVDFENAKVALDAAVEKLTDAKEERDKAYDNWIKYSRTLDFEELQIALVNHVLNDDKYAPFNDTLAGTIRTTKDPDTLEFWAEACGLDLDEFCKGVQNYE